MTRFRAVSLVVVSVLALIPTTAGAGGHVHRSASRAVVVSRFHHRVFIAPFVHRRPFFPIVVTAIAPPFIATAVPPLYAAPAYAAPSTVYAPPVAVDPPVAAAPATPPVPTLIEYPGGWYQLRGDGATTPYTWVWIPKPPPPPAAATPPAPTVPPPPAEPPAPPSSSSRSSSPATTLYRWTDDQGVSHWTDRRERVPEGARVQIERF
jgi:hypothetical protein